MKSLLVALLSFILIGSSQAQDLIPAKGGDISITPILHGTFVIQYQDLTIYVDPYGGAERFSGQQKPDRILKTDIHGDHHDQKTLDGLDLSDAILIAPQAVADKLPSGKSKAIKVLENGRSTTLSGVKIEAIPMYNLPETEDSRHPKGRGNGYIVEIGGQHIYISGDTEDIPEMRALRDIDIAFVCMNLPYTMDVAQAADAVSEFKPRIVYPFHFRGREGLADVAKFKELVNAAAPTVEVRLRNWYPEN
ncbi:hypothetical protein GCM10009119_32670 [Algoriphagus jejuensis]|uniref:L-ascorbate metabolism protein UlaG (Beta-lactamase superfamily) n=1 Tax=Algoriphagus jejuensis TaxID=419934 RepID=A0ABN1N351_9BACT